MGTPGARQRRTRRPIAAPTWCSVTSQRQAPTGSGRGLHLPALLGGQFVLCLRDRRARGPHRRGSQYTSADYTQTLSDHGVLASVGSVGDAYDNAMGRELRRHLQDRADRRPRSKSLCSSLLSEDPAAAASVAFHIATLHLLANAYLNRKLVKSAPKVGLQITDSGDAKRGCTQVHSARHDTALGRGLLVPAVALFDSPRDL